MIDYQKNRKPICPITGKPLPAGYYAHPTLLNPLIKKLDFLPTVCKAATYLKLGLTAPRKNTGGSTQSSTRILLNLQKLDEINDMFDSINAWVLETRKYCQPYAKLNNISWETKADLLKRNADHMFRRPNGAEFYDEITHAIIRLERLSDPPKSRTPLMCPHCGQTKYYIITAARVRCANTECATLFPVKETQDKMLKKISNKELTIMQIKDVLNCYGYPIPIATVRQWSQRKQLPKNKVGKYKLQDAVKLAKKWEKRKNGVSA